MQDALITSIQSSAHALLTPARERALAVACAAGDKDARAQLILCNQRLVYSIAKQWLRSGVPLTDLVQAGTLGLIRAVDKFEPERGFKLSTYATWWIRVAVDTHVAECNQVSRHVWEQTKRLRQAQVLYPHADDDELAEHAQVKPHLVAPILAFTGPAVSLEWESEDGVTRELVDEDTDVAYDAVAAAQLAEIKRALVHVDPRQRRALELRYGLDDKHERTLEEIGEDLGVTRERARQLIARAEKTLRARCNAVTRPRTPPHVAAARPWRG